MREELDAAIEFICKNFFKLTNNLNTSEIDTVKETLLEILQERYKNHWYEGKPLKGQAYRCIRLRKNDETMDFVVDLLINKLKNTKNLNINSYVCKTDITLWVDPGEVCCRYGEAIGNTFTIFQVDLNKRQRTESTSSSSSATPPPAPQQSQQQQCKSPIVEQQDEIFEFLTPSLNEMQSSLSHELALQQQHQQMLTASFNQLEINTSGQMFNTNEIYSCSPSSYSTASSSSISSNVSDGTRTPISVYGDSERSDTPSTQTQSDQQSPDKNKTYCGYVESYPYYYKLNRLYNALAIQKMQSDRLKKQLMRGSSGKFIPQQQQPQANTTPAQSPPKIVKHQQQPQQRPHSYHQSQTRLTNAINIPHQNVASTINSSTSPQLAQQQQALNYFYGLSPALTQATTSPASTSPQTANYLYHQMTTMLPQMSTITSMQQQQQQQQVQSQLTVNLQQATSAANNSQFDPMNWIRGSDLIKSKN